jgi:hypothetical protein
MTTVLIISKTLGHDALNFLAGWIFEVQFQNCLNKTQNEAVDAKQSKPGRRNCRQKSQQSSILN